jgi:hypothetical protein
MNINEEIDSYIEDVMDKEFTYDTLLRRSLFMAGQLDTSGATVEEIMSKPAIGTNTPSIDERTRWAIGLVGELIGIFRSEDAVVPAPVVVAVTKVP